MPPATLLERLDATVRSRLVAPWRGGTVRPALVSAGLAACCAIALAAVVDVGFVRERIGVVGRSRASSGGRVDIALPDTSALARQAVAIVLRLRNEGPGTRLVRVALAGSELARVRLSEGEEARVDLGLPPDARPAAGERLEFSAEADGWSVRYLELANVHGFSTWPLSFVIVPRAAERRSPPPATVCGAVFLVLLLVPGATRDGRSRVSRVLYRVSAGLTLGFLLAVLLAGLVSSFRIWLSPQAFAACVLVLYSPALTAGIAAAARRVPSVDWSAGTKGRQAAWLVLYVACTALFLGSYLDRYDSRTGFTALIRFGELFHERALPAVQQVPHVVLPRSPGYDGQFYAQMAVDPLLRDPGINRALDSVSYRARRILFAWTAYVLGLGQPYWVLQAYAVQSVLAWLLLAVILWHWLPPASAKSFVPWFGCLFGHGAVVSVLWALPDGPALLVVALAVLALERGRPRTGALAIGLAGLGKETSLLAAPALVSRGGGTDLARALTTLLIVVAPLLIWLAYLWLGNHLVTQPGGSRNFSLPLLGYWNHWTGTLDQLRVSGWSSDARNTLLALVGLTTQLAALVTGRAWRTRWGRVGLAYGALMLVLGPAVWEGSPSAAPRALLPMTVAFNVTLRERAWFWPWCLLGNLTVVPGVSLI